jgi:hypothetical protein
MSSAEGPKLQQVFIQSGIPEYTFVEPVEYPKLLVALQTPGRSIVIEGPSGIGKTTAIMKAISSAGISDNVITLSARKKDDVELIKELPNQLPIGTVMIDDFHRLGDEHKGNIADLMKTLADEGDTESKLIVLGITNAGQSLILFGKDLANRIEVVPFEANPEHKIEQLISAGERALNVEINIKEEIINAAQGSFYLAQMLSYHACLRSGILFSDTTKRTTGISYESIKTEVMSTLARSFHGTAIAFARGTKLRREGRAPYLHLLYWLSQSKSWSINALREADRNQSQRGSVSQVVTKGFLQELINSSPDIQGVLHFDNVSNTLVVQDPQFIYYIRNLSWPQFSEEVGFISIDFPSRYDFALSFAGTDRPIAEALFHALQDNELEVFYDKNEQHRILAEDVEEYLGPIYSSDALLVICILGPDYPKRIWAKFESERFKQRFKSGEVIPIILDTTFPGIFDDATKVGYIAWKTTENFKDQIDSATKDLIQKCTELRGRKMLAKCEAAEEPPAQ